MKHLTLTLVFLGGVLGVMLNPALADEKKHAPLSYAGEDADSKIAGAVVAMQDLAKGKYEAHKAEGLFEKHPAEGQLILEMVAVSRELQAKAETAGKAGDTAKARAYNFSAEATARYAAKMPHMLKARAQDAGKVKEVEKTKEAGDPKKPHDPKAATP